ncbi:caspase family protein [Actinomadura sp. ATCC 31491]|uniref:Caspase family protein n=1 Tax=Actinomadura luzonensis TaxID=2805427 RepID=A0ABT0FQP2_9ACTN|nr:NERD domain-containing protein [Actinomadura luzonensis]MCK2214335.1 caspase family protein [Actinomadura luzonensis]
MTVLEPAEWRSSQAILIGVAAYDDQRLPDIPAAANSLAELQTVLTDPQLCGWPNTKVVVLADPHDSRAVATRIRRLAQGVSDVLLLYYVGHGTLTPSGELCLSLTDTDAEAPDLTGLEYGRIRSAFRDSPARVKAVILDCCYSGRAIETLADQAALVADQTDIRGVYTLTASDLAAHVPPPEKQADACTSFTGELVELIRIGIPGEGDQLSLGNIYLELRRRLRIRGLPAPNQRGTDTAHSFAFTKNAAAGPPVPKKGRSQTYTVQIPIELTSTHNQNLQPSYRHLWRRALIAAVLGMVVSFLTRDWRLGVSVAIFAAIAEAIYEAWSSSSVPAWRHVSAMQPRTEAKLRRLERSGYRMLHARTIPGTGVLIDHMIIGPTGVYTVTSEKWNKRLTVRTQLQSELWRGPFSQRSRLDEVRSTAIQAGDRISAALGLRITVTPSLSIYGPSTPWKTNTIRDVAVFKSFRVRKWITTQVECVVS